MATLYQIVKDGVPIAVTGDKSKADDYYAALDCDEIRTVESDELGVGSSQSNQGGVTWR